MPVPVPVPDDRGIVGFGGVSVLAPDPGKRLGINMKPGNDGDGVARLRIPGGSA
jgi:hypothetical protein